MTFEAKLAEICHILTCWAIELTNLDVAATEGVKLNPKKLKSIKVPGDDYVENRWEGVG